MASVLEYVITIGLVLLAVVTAWSVLTNNNLFIG